MGEIAAGTERVLIADTYSEDTRRLWESLQCAGCCDKAYVLEETGFLPDGVESVYGYFLGSYAESLGNVARPRYFNEIEVPEYWEITGTQTQAGIYDMTRECGRIFYAEPKCKRFVKTVDWYDERGIVRFSDHYNRYGALYARTVFDAQGKAVNRSYFSPEGRVVLEENFITKAITLNREGTITIFPDKMKFLAHFAEQTELKKKRVYYNSLSTSFFLTRLLPAEVQEDVLFWQEPEREDVPGNMLEILNHRTPRTSRIYVQNAAAYGKLKAVTSGNGMLRPLGYIYPFERENKLRPEALICTNSDRIEKLLELTETLYDVNFHIVAQTEMSKRLLAFEGRKNVFLYPAAGESTINRLFERCDLYLDINYGGEMGASVFRAFLQNQLIWAFRETAHNRNYLAADHIFPSGEYQSMIAGLKRVLSDPVLWRKRLVAQQTAAMSASAEDYRNAGL